MKTTLGYAAVFPDGQFLSVSESQSHAGVRLHCGKVTDIDFATVFYTPQFMSWSKDLDTAMSREDMTWVHIEVDRNVTLTGYGVAK